MVKKNGLAISSGRSKSGKVLPSWPRGEVAARCAINRIDTTCSCSQVGQGIKREGEVVIKASVLVSNLQSLAAKLSQLKIAFEWRRWKHNDSMQHAACGRQRQRFPSNFPLLRESLRLTGAKTKAKSWSCALRLRLRLEVVAVSRWPKKVCQVFDKDQVHLR